MGLFNKNNKRKNIPEYQCPKCSFPFSGRPAKCPNCGLIFTWDTYDQKHSKTTQRATVSYKITNLRGFQTINSVRDNSKKTIYSLQELAVPNSRKGTIPFEQILYSCDLVLTQNLEIVQDCCNLIYNTENPRVFFERYDLLLGKLCYMQYFEPYVEIRWYQPSESLEYYKNHRPYYERKMIDRVYKKAVNKAATLKTDKGKRNQFVKALDSLSIYEHVIQPNNQAYLIRKFNKQIASYDI